MAKKKEESKNGKKGYIEVLESRSREGVDKKYENEILLIPKIDIWEREDGYTLVAEVPGIKKDELNIKVTNEELVLQGKKDDKFKEKGENILSELDKGVYFRRFRIKKEIDCEKITANLENGMLLINFPLRKLE
ncbi:hypothetical protein DRQ09_04575 [candidate division KSB1 bacterium]|nr:MAG: hypothetical protein DRQ09_04575 [candidate division KSB1 bacterium]